MEALGASALGSDAVALHVDSEDTQQTSIMRALQQPVGSQRSTNTSYHPGQISQADETFTAMVTQYGPMMYRVLRSMLGNPADAADIAQDTYLKAWRGWQTQRDRIDDPKNWLLTIATRTAIDELRHRRVITWVPYEHHDTDGGDASQNDFGDIAIATPAGSSDIEQEVIERDEARRALMKMPHAYRVALLLHDAYGFSTADIAAQLGLAESGMKMFLSRARHSFRQCISEMEADTEVSKSA